MTAIKPPVVSVLLDPDWASGSLVDDVRRGFNRSPRRLPPKWLYDDNGSELYDEITRLEEYYPFRAERSILEAHAEEIAEASGFGSRQTLFRQLRRHRGDGGRALRARA